MLDKEAALTTISSPQFLRAAGLAGVGAGLVTALIWLLPLVYGSPTSLAERVELHADPLFLLRLWLSFINVFLILVASWGLTAHRLRASPGAASTGMLFLVFYGAAELLGRSAMIFTQQYRWIHQLQSETDPERVQALERAVSTFDEVFRGWFPLLLIAFALSSACLLYTSDAADE